VISNTGRTPGRVLRHLLADAGLLECFHVLAFSDEAGIRKPAAAIFHRVLDQVGVEPKAAVHVGDDPVTDVAGARAVGMRVIHYVPEASAEAAADEILRRFADLPGVVARLERS
jgi:FMN phosphatase YigB (HAD superfamily)